MSSASLNKTFPSLLEDTIPHALVHVENEERKCFIAHTMAFVTSVIEHWFEQEIFQWVHHEGLIRQPIVDALPQSYILLPSSKDT